MLNKNALWRSILPLCCILFIDAMSFGFVLPELGELFLSNPHLLSPTTTVAMRHFLYSFTVAIPMAFQFFGSPIIGSLSDRIGRKKTLMISLLGICLCCLLSGFGLLINSVFVLIAGRALLGLLNSNESIAQAAIADLSTHENKASNMSLITLAGTAGFILGPILGSYLSDPKIVSWFNDQIPFYFSTALCFINIILLWILFDETYVVKKHIKINWREMFNNLFDGFKSKSLRTIAVIFFCMQFAWGLYFQSISLLLLTENNLSVEQIGGFLTYIAIVFMFTLLFIIRRLHKKMSPMMIIKVGMLLITIGGLITGLCHSTWSILLAVLPTGIGVGISYNTLLALFSNAASKDEQGKIMGISVALTALGWIIAAGLSGIFSGVYLHFPYIIIAGVGFIAFLYTARIRRYEI